MTETLKNVDMVNAHYANLSQKQIDSARALKNLYELPVTPLTDALVQELSTLRSSLTQDPIMGGKDSIDDYEAAELPHIDIETLSQLFKNARQKVLKILKAASEHQKKMNNK